MRFLFKALLAATALLPVATAATAQDGWRDRGGDRSDRGDRIDRGPMAGDDAPAGGTVETRGNRTGNEPSQRRREDRSPQVAIAPAPPQTVGRPEGQAPRDWNRSRLDPGRSDGLRGERRDQGIAQGRDDQRGGQGRRSWNNQRDERNWTSSRQVQQRDDRRFDDRGGRGQDWRNDGRSAGRYNQGNWNRTWRNDNRYDWNRYRTGNRNAYRLPRYYAPQGWGYGYRRFSIGVTLSALLWNESYWIEDPYAYRLPEAYGPYRWVRYYNDALLVDVRDGRVVDSVYGIFW